MNWEPVQPADNYDVPLPAACPDGWASHTWTLGIADCSITLSTTECVVCSRGFEYAMACEFVVGEFPVSIAFDSDHGPSGEGLGGWHYIEPCDCNWWWTVTPVSSDAAADVDGDVDGGVLGSADPHPDVAV